MKKTGRLCGECPRGHLKPGRVTVDFGHRPVHLIIENVPAEVCDECDTQILSWDVVGRVEEYLADRRNASRRLKVIRFEPASQA